VALVLIGFMGAGKSTLARQTQGAVDTDAVLERELGEPVEAFFDREGEAAFRAREEQVVLAALAGGAPLVALGGGAVLSERVQAALADHAVAWLQVSLDTAWERAEGSTRPLARDREGFAALHAERRELYAQLASAVVMEGATRTITYLTGMRPGERRMVAVGGRDDYLVTFCEGLPAGRHEGDFVLSDENVGPLHATDAFVIPAGEEHKTLGTAERVWTEMARRGVTRGGRLIAVGGGVVGDLGGFVAASYQRGIPVVQVPTTLVAQVDSAYGGKTGVDLPEAKNYVGAYHQPQSVIVGSSYLETLPAAERAAGYAEVVKTALIAGGRLWDRVRAGAVDDQDVIFDCARTKLEIVAADERDGGLRQVLNLGHTVAHAIETTAGYGTYRHGEAVGLGLLAALRLSGQDALRGEVEGLLAAQGLPTRLKGVDTADIVRTTRADKKRIGDEVPFVLVEDVGRVTFGHTVGEPALASAVAELAA
jgi:shikimate kinase/3-dehydroquinate synthase